MLFILFLSLFLVLGFYLLNFYRYDLINKDVISMISVARLYAAGNFTSAVNGYWGPLFSWLLDLFYTLPRYCPLYLDFSHFWA